MSVYKLIKDEFHRTTGMVAQNCWISHVLADMKLTTRIAHNRANPLERKKPCPPKWRQELEAAVGAVVLGQPTGHPESLARQDISGG